MKKCSFSCIMCTAGENVVGNTIITYEIEDLYCMWRSEDEDLWRWRYFISSKKKKIIEENMWKSDKNSLNFFVVCPVVQFQFPEFLTRSFLAVYVAFASWEWEKKSGTCTSKMLIWSRGIREKKIYAKSTHTRSSALPNS